MKYIKTTISIFLLLILFSCVKDKGIIDQKFALTETDFSIPTDNDVVQFELINENVIIAVTIGEFDQVSLWKTINKGVTWEEFQNLPFTNLSDFNTLVCLSENDISVLIEEKIYRSLDGGTTWTVLTHSMGTTFQCIGHTDENKLIAISWEYPYPNQHKWKVYNEGELTSTTIFQKYFIDKLNKSRFSGNLYFFYNISIGSNYNVYYLDPSNPSIDTMYFGTKDVVSSNNYTTFCGGSGFTEYNLTTGYSTGKGFYVNEDYVTKPIKSIDLLNEKYIAVGENTIIGSVNSTDIQYLSTPEGKPFLNYYYWTRWIDNNSFYAAGKKGLFRKYSFI